MKTITTIAFIGLFNLSYAYDLSKTESYKEAYRENADGSSSYIGKCSTHQDFEAQKFKVTQTIIPYFEPNFDENEKNFEKRISKLDSKLKEIVLNHINFESLKNVDDLTVEKIILFKRPNLDLYRLNIGVGGGNGMYLVFSKLIKNSEVQFELMSDVFDGDVEYCDHKIWFK
jgi:hypothetical protein